jgi:hypothetical protein
VGATNAVRASVARNDPELNRTKTSAKYRRSGRGAYQLFTGKVK